MTDQKEEVKLHTDIVSLIGEHIKLTRAGKHYKGLCPFHAEKTPSFIVSPELQIYKCFGCGQSGDAFSFLMEYEGMEFIEALRFLADRAGIKLTSQYNVSSQKDILHKLNTIAAQFYHYVLLNHPAGREALDYITKQRFVAPDALEVFQIGYAPQSPTALYSYLVNKKKFKPEEVVAAGLAVNIVDKHKVFDRFRGRIIFPLFDHRGNSIGLAGRIMPGPGAEKLAKYINSPETEVYHKSSVLYGFNVTRGAIKQEKKAVIVEGELDLISSWQSGVKNVVAIKGSALTEDQVRILSRVTSEIVLALDSDLAGDAAARRGITIAMNQGMSVRVSNNDPYKDPDEYARGNPKGYKQSLDKAIGVWDFIIDSVISRNNAESGEGKAKISREVVPMLAGIEDSIVQAHYAKVLAEKLDVPAEAVLTQIESKKKPQERSPAQQEQNEPKSIMARRELLEEDLISLMLASNPELLQEEKYAGIFSSHFVKRVIEEIKKHSDSAFDLKSVMSALPAELSDRLASIILKNTADLSPEAIRREIELTFSELQKLDNKQKREELTKQIAKFEKSGDDEQLSRVQSELTKLN